MFNLLEELVSREHGDETWDDLLEASGLEGAYTSLGSYPDEDLTRLVGSASGPSPGPRRARSSGSRPLSPVAHAGRGGGRGDTGGRRRGGRETMKRVEPVRILLVEDQPADVRLTREILAQGKVANDLYT